MHRPNSPFKSCISFKRVSELKIYSSVGAAAQLGGEA